jgi:hypothetical protein
LPEMPCILNASVPRVGSHADIVGKAQSAQNAAWDST